LPAAEEEDEEEDEEVGGSWRWWATAAALIFRARITSFEDMLIVPLIARGVRCRTIRFAITEMKHEERSRLQESVLSGLE
jgi:hypothetical protein